MERGTVPAARTPAPVVAPDRLAFGADPIAVLVIDPSGEPVVGARVACRDRRGRVLDEALSDGGGQAELAGTVVADALFGRFVWIGVESQSHRRWAGFVSRADLPLTVRMESGWQTSVRLLDEAQRPLPLESCWAVAPRWAETGDRERWIAANVRADPAREVLEVKALDPDIEYLLVGAEGYRTELLAVFLGDPERVHTGNLEPASPRVLVVVGPRGQPIADAVAVDRMVAGYSPLETVHTRYPADRSGRIVCADQPDLVLVTAPGFESATVSLESPHEQRVVLEPVTALELRLLDSDGRPVQMGVQVRDRENFSMDTKLSATLDRGHTDAEGRVRFEGLPSGLRLGLRVTPAHSAHGTYLLRRDLEALAQGEEREVEVVLEGLRRVDLSLALEGQAVAGSVVCTPLELDGEGACSVEIDSGGRGAIWLTRDAWRVEGRALGHDARLPGRAGTVELAPGRDAELHFELGEIEALRGRVVDPEGVPLVGRRVVAVSGAEVAAITATDRSGGFELRPNSLYSGALYVADSTGNLSARFPVARRGDVGDLVLSECRVELEVLGLETGQRLKLPLKVGPLEGRVGSDGDLELAKHRLIAADADGVYRFTLTPGSWTLVAHQDLLEGLLHHAQVFPGSLQVGQEPTLLRWTHVYGEHGYLPARPPDRMNERCVALSVRGGAGATAWRGEFDLTGEDDSARRGIPVPAGSIEVVYRGAQGGVWMERFELERADNSELLQQGY